MHRISYRVYIDMVTYYINLRKLLHEYFRNVRLVKSFGSIVILHTVLLFGRKFMKQFAYRHTSCTHYM